VDLGNFLEGDLGNGESGKHAKYIFIYTEISAEITKNLDK
jgi:hypothetical protein